MTIQGLDSIFNQDFNIKALDREQVKSYISRLNCRIEQLSTILVSDERKFVAPYLKILGSTLECLALKYSLPSEDQVDFSLTISPTNSGFPTVQDFYFLQKDKQSADDYIQQLPDEQSLIEEIRNSILKDRSASTPQVLLQRLRYFSKLKETKLLEENHQNEPKLIDEDRDKRSYVVEWTAIEKGINVPVLYVMYLTQNRRSIPLEKRENPTLDFFIYQSQNGIVDLRSLVCQMDHAIEDIRPKLIYKYIIGPYHDGLTNNTPEITNLFDGVDEPSMLRFRIEAVASQYQRRMIGKLGRIFGDEISRILGFETVKEVYGPLDNYDRRIIVPFGVKQIMGNKDEMGNPSQVYGITKGGEIIL